MVLLDSWRFPATTPAGISEDLDITKRLDAFLAANVTVVAGSGSGLSTYSEWHWCSERTALQVHVCSAHALLFVARLAAGRLPASNSDREAQGWADAAPCSLAAATCENIIGGHPAVISVAATGGSDDGSVLASR